MSSLFEFSAEVTRWALTIYEWIIIIAILVSWVNPVELISSADIHGNNTIVQCHLFQGNGDFPSIWCRPIVGINHS